MSDSSVPFYRLQQGFPSESNPLSLEQSLRHVGLSEAAHELDGTLIQMDSLTKVASAPILGVAGMLNSGKSSVVACFLSERGRARVLRGINQASGTQRFVFWFPDRWKLDEALWEALVEAIKAVFGQKLEMLSDEVDRAHQQYSQTSSAGDLLGVPLVATDPNLTDLAIVDCPDVQRPDHHSTREHTAQTRLEFLTRASKACSAFLFVATEANVHDADAVKTAGELRTRMRRIPFHLLINQADPDRKPHEVLKDVRYVLDQMELDRCFLAYNYAIPGWDRVTPPELHPYIVGASSKENRLPAAFELDANPEVNPPNPVQNERFLEALPARLQAAGLGRSQLGSIWEYFVRLQSEKIQLLAAEAEKETASTRELHEKLKQLLLSEVTDRKGNPRIPLSSEVADQIQSKMESNAPSILRPFLWGGRKSRQALAGGRDWLREQFSKHGDKLSEEKLDALDKAALRAEDLAFAMRNRDFPKIAGDKEALEQAWGHVLQRTILATTDLLQNIESSKMDDAAAKAWEQVAVGGRAKVAFSAVVTLVVGVVAVAAIPFDGGATAGVVTTVAGGTTAGAVTAVAGSTAAVIGHASLYEILAVTGVSGVAAIGVAANALAKALEEEIFMPYFSNFFFSACDAFGVPRMLGDVLPLIEIRGQQRQLRHSPLSVEAPQSGLQARAVITSDTKGGEAFQFVMTRCSEELKNI